MNPSTLTVDWSSWDLDTRIKLLGIVDELHAKAVAGVGTPQTEEPATVPDDVEPSGWDEVAYTYVVTRLLNRHKVQAAVIREAIRTGTGYVPRARVYELGGYAENRSLKGFTRPINRFTADGIEEGMIDEEADDLLTPDYDPAVTGYQRARGFMVPMEVVKLGQQWHAEHGDTLG